MKAVKFIVALLFGLMFIYAGIGKFFPQIIGGGESPSPEQMKLFEAFSTIKWLMPLVGIIEILGGVLFIFPKTRALGAIVVLPVMVGILIHNMLFSFGSSSGIVIALVLLIINIWMIIDNRNKYRLLIS